MHITSWPEAKPEWQSDVKEMKLILSILRGVRQLRSQNQFSATAQVKKLIIDLSKTANDQAEQIKQLERSLQAVARAESIDYGSADYECEGTDLKIAVDF